MLTITDNGTAGIFVKYLSTPAEAIGKDLLNIPVEATHMIRFTSQDTAMLYGTRIYGATSSAEAVVVGYELISGTVGTTGAGILFVRDITGTFQAENIGVTAGADDATIILPVALKVAGLPAKAAFVTTEGAVSFTFDGTIPTVTAGTDMGHEYADALNFWVYGHENLKNMQWINTVNASGAAVKLTLFY